MQRVDRSLTILALIAAVLYLLLLGVQPYPGGVVLKTSMCVLLVVLAWRKHKRLLAVALLFSATGDALLAVDAAQLFVPALVSFLVTHLLYAAVFLTASKLRLADLSIWRVALLVAVPLFAVAYTALLWPALGNLALPVTCYIAAIVVMTVLSLRVPTVWVPIGAVLFLASDSLIALDKFLWQAPWIGPAIWITYAAAQLLIVYGLLAALASNRMVINTTAVTLER